MKKIAKTIGHIVFAVIFAVVLFFKMPVGASAAGVLPVQAGGTFRIETGQTERSDKTAGPKKTTQLNVLKRPINILPGTGRSALSKRNGCTKLIARPDAGIRTSALERNESNEKLEPDAVTKETGEVATNRTSFEIMTSQSGSDDTDGWEMILPADMSLRSESCLSCLQPAGQRKAAGLSEVNSQDKDNQKSTQNSTYEQPLTDETEDENRQTDIKDADLDQYGTAGGDTAEGAAAGIQQNTSSDQNEQDGYLEGYDDLYSALPEVELEDKAGEIAENYGLDPKNPNWVENLNPKNAFEMIKDFISDGFKTPLTVTLTLIAIMLLVAAFSSFLQSNEYFSRFVNVAAAAVVLLPLFSVLSSVGQTLSSVANFMLSFIPAFMGILLSGGFVGTVSASSPLLLFATNAVAEVSANGFLPLMGSYLSLSICGSISPAFGLSSVANSIKNAANWIMGIFTTLFLGILSVGGAVSASADNLALKTTRFLVNGVPVVGGAIGESLAATRACTELLKSSFGIWGVVGIVLILLPMLLSLLMWKAALFVSSSVSDVFGVDRMSAFLKTVSAVVSVTIGILIFVGMLFIIGLAVLIKVKSG